MQDGIWEKIKKPLVCSKKKGFVTGGTRFFLTGDAVV
jgi:hypothetical protein